MSARTTAGAADPDRGRSLVGQSFHSGCYAPFAALYLDPRGRVLACCQNDLHVLGRIPESTLLDIWRGEAANELRAAVRAGDLSRGCELCAVCLDRGDPEAAYLRAFDDLRPDPAPAWPLQLDLALSNACNLQCVMCNGELSSAIRVHREGRPPLPTVYGDAFFEQLDEFLPHLRRVSFLGGEPFLAPEAARVMRRLDERGLRPQCHVTTNGMVWGARVDDLLGSLPFHLVVSIDGTSEATNAAIRAGVDHARLLANIRSIRASCAGRERSMSLAFCLMADNWHELGDVLALGDELDVDVVVNAVTHPPQHSLVHRSDDDLRAVVAALDGQDREHRVRLDRNRHVWDREVDALRTVASGRRRGSSPATPVALRPRPSAARALQRASEAADPRGVTVVTAGTDQIVSAVDVLPSGAPGLGLGNLVGGSLAECLDALGATFGVPIHSEVRFDDDGVEERLLRFEGATTTTVIATMGLLEDGRQRWHLAAGAEPPTPTASVAAVSPELDEPADGRGRAGSVPGVNGAFPDDALHGSVADRLLAMCEPAPAAVAISSPAGTWTYGELERDVRRWAASIAAAEPGTTPVPVAILAEHDGPLVVAILSVIAAGHIVVVLDSAAPAEAVDHVLAESGLPLVLHDDASHDAVRALASRHPELRTASLASLDVDQDGISLPVRGPADPLMLAFTSGTSGAPKAAVISHGAILNLVRGATNALGVTSADRMPMLFPTSLAVASYPMFIPLLNGATLATLDVRGVGLAPVADFLVRERITLAYMAPTVVRFLVDAVAGYEFPDLRMIALGGELVDPEVVRLTVESFGPPLLANGFGTTETGVVALYVIDPADPPADVVPAGYPVADVEFLILDDAGQPVPAGESGEIAVASPYLFDGYRGHADLTAQVLAPDPAGRAGWRSYRTGDLGHLDAGGALVVSGRLDTKIKVRGRFVVLGDVEAELHRLEGVVDAVAVGVTRHGSTELAAVVAAPEGDRPSTTSMRSALLERMEAYRVPATWVLVDELPRLPNGKVDRRAAAELAQDAAGAPTAGGVDAVSAAVAGTDAGPDRELQRELRSIWELLLPVEEVGLDDDFSELGGDSLLAAQMLVMAEQRVGVTVPMGELIEARTIRSLAEVMTRIRATRRPSSAICVVPGDASRPRLWFVPDLQGSAYRVRHLAQHLGSDQPLWSFESPLLNGLRNDLRRLDVFAARLVSDLRAVQPEGPYYLAGYSFGGICAYEMARQIRRDGDEVAFLGVVDVGPGYRGPSWRDARSPLRPWFGVAKPPPAGSSPLAALAHYRSMLQASPRGAARHLMVRSGLYRWIDPMRFRSDLLRQGRIRPEWRLWYAWEEHWKLAAKAWDRTRPYDRRLDLFWADETAATDSSMGWAPLVADLHVHRFPGNHTDVLEPVGAPALAKAVREVLDARPGS